MFFVFALLYSGQAIEQAFYQLVSSQFRKSVLNRSTNDVWMVMFSGATCPACKMAYPHFVNASKLGGGMVKFGYIDVNRCQDIANMYDIRTIPQFRIFHSSGETEYEGNRKARDFLNTAASFIVDKSFPVDETWKDSYLLKPSAILFTNKEKTPKIWSAISSYYHGKPIRIGTSHTDDYLADYGIEEVPAIYFTNGTNNQIYDGKIEYGAVKEAIESFFAKRLKPEQPTEGKSNLTPADFETQCLGGRGICILSLTKKSNDVIDKLSKANARHKFKWLIGSSKFPYKFMKLNDIWVYNPRRDGFLKVDSIDNLEGTIDRIIDGQARWTKRDKLISGETEL